MCEVGGEKEEKGSPAEKQSHDPRRSAVLFGLYVNPNADHLRLSTCDTSAWSGS